MAQPGGRRVGLGVLGADVGEFDEGGEGGAEGFGVFASPLDGFATACCRAWRWEGEWGAGPPGAVDPGEVEVGEAGRQLAECGEVGEFGGEVDAAVVGADAFAAAQCFVSSGLMEKAPVSRRSTASP